MHSYERASCDDPWTRLKPVVCCIVGVMVLRAAVTQHSRNDQLVLKVKHCVVYPTV